MPSLDPVHSLIWLVVILSAILFLVWRGDRLSGQKLLLALLRAIPQILLFALLYYLLRQSDLSGYWRLAIFLALAALYQGSYLWWRFRDKLAPGQRRGLWPLFVGASLTSFLATTVLVFGLLAWPVSSGFWQSPWLWGPLAFQLVLAMTVGMTLSAGHFFHSLLHKRDKVNAALALGLAYSDSFKWLIQESLRRAMMPVAVAISFLGAGFFPPLMNGLLASLPLSQALRLEGIALAAMLLAAVVSTLLVLTLLYRQAMKDFLPERTRGKRRR
jgi:ABC-type iron transport system FetAB permease component